MISIIDYGAGNLRSVAKAMEKLGQPARITTDAEEVLAAGAVILPGVGAAADAMNKLGDADLIEPIKQLVAQGRPLFAVCLGLQLLLSVSEEGGEHPCLDVISGRVRRLPDGLKVPHMGWNQVWQKNNHPIFIDIPDGAHFYFVHSYYADPEDDEVIAGETDYDIQFCSLAVKDRIVATQFHPEKSGELGLQLYENFLKWSGAWK
jgi:glutamine amidotransferase